jgi:uncharacterized protein (TIGR00251 family)
VSSPIRLQLRVSPGAGRSAVVGRHGAAWKLRVAAPAEDGRANGAVVGLLAETLGMPRRDVAIVAGRAARDKVVALEGLDLGEIERRLGLAAARGGAA